MIKKVSEYIGKNNLIEDGDRIILGVSGGADSICLLYVLADLYGKSSIKMTAVHVNHGIRGSEADRDEQFVQDTCKKFGVDCAVYRYDILRIAKEGGISPEEAGRKMRYQAFYEACRKFRCNKVAIAHNKNDIAETVLFHLFRGSGIKGLSGIDSFRTMEAGGGKITIIRPLLFAGREEIEAFLSDKKVPYQTDSTNQSDDYTRNKIRNRVLSYVTGEINSNAINHIAGAAARLAEINRFIEKCIDSRYDALVREKDHAFLYPISEISGEDVVIQKGIIYKILGNLAGCFKDIETKHIDEVRDLGSKQVGKQVHLPYGIIALREYASVKMYRNTGEKNSQSSGGKPLEPVVINIPGRIYLQKYHKYLETEIIPYENNRPIPKNSCMKWFDYDKIENTVELRTRRTGDYIQINPDGGRKKLKDYFIDTKIPKEERNEKLLVADGSHIMWIPGDGDRISEKYKIGNATGRILSMKLIDAEEKEDDR